MHLLPLTHERLILRVVGVSSDACIESKPNSSMRKMGHTQHQIIPNLLPPLINHNTICLSCSTINFSLWFLLLPSILLYLSTRLFSIPLHPPTSPPTHFIIPLPLFVPSLFHSQQPTTHPPPLEKNEKLQALGQEGGRHF